jgi:SAM-dependent methyltransferase
MTAAAPYRFKSSPYSSHSLLLAALPENGGGRTVLDVGCGPGYLAEALAGRGYRVTGVESPGRAGATFPPEVKLMEADLDQGFPAMAGAFDYVLCADILEHLREPGRLLAEIRARLSPGGRVLASLPNSGHLYFRWQVLRGRFPAEDRGLFDRTHLHFYTWQGWVDLFRAAGFGFAEVRPSGVPVGLALPRWEHSAAVRAMERLSWRSARAWKTLFAYQFVVTAVPR